MKGVWTGEKIKDKGKRIKVGGAGRRQAKVRGKRQETNNPSFRLQWVFCRSDKGRRDASDRGDLDLDAGCSRRPLVAHLRLET